MFFHFGKRHNQMTPLMMSASEVREVNKSSEADYYLTFRERSMRTAEEKKAHRARLAKRLHTLRKFALRSEEHFRAIEWWAKNMEHKCPNCGRQLKIYKAPRRISKYRHLVAKCCGKGGCDYVWSPTSRTMAHKSKIDLGIWLYAARKFMENGNITATELSRNQPIGYVDAYRLVKRMKTATLIIVSDHIARKGGRAADYVQRGDHA